MSIVMNSFSKYFAMTGWRLGWMLVPPELRRAVDCLTGNFTICPPVLAQFAAVAAFTPESVAEADARVEHYAVNRERLLNGLRAIGLDRLAPTDGAFYVYADVSDVTTDSMSFCSKLLADTGVAIAPGIDFDTVHGNSFVRLSFAGPTEDIDEALRRIEPWLAGLAGRTALLHVRPEHLLPARPTSCRMRRCAAASARSAGREPVGDEFRLSAGLGSVDPALELVRPGQVEGVCVLERRIGRMSPPVSSLDPLNIRTKSVGSARRRGRAFRRRREPAACRQRAGRPRPLPVR